MQILVLGMHRSGTSMVTRLVNMMGAYFGPESSTGEITIDNPKGFWERPEVFKLNESILASHQCTWQDLRRWQVQNAAQQPEKATQFIKKFLLGMDAFRPWVLKDPRMCLLLPGWLPHLEAPIAIICHRNPTEIALSLAKRDNLTPEYALALWETYTVTMLNASLRLPRIHVRHGELMREPIKNTEFLYAMLRESGVRRIEMPSEREILGFIDPRLHRSRAQTPLPLTPSQVHLCDILKGNTTQTGLLKISEPSRALIQQGPKTIGAV